jgi:hypothetical protein
MSATWLLALGGTFKIVRDEPRPYRVARRFFPRFAGQQAGGHGASRAAAEWPERAGGPAPAPGVTGGGGAQGAAGATRGAATRQQPPALGTEAAGAKWQRWTRLLAHARRSATV